MHVPIMFGRKPEHEGKDDEGDGALFFPGENQPAEFFSPHHPA